MPATDRPIYVSWSQIDTYAQCGKKYELSYVGRVPKQPQGAFIGGHAVHAAIEFGEPEELWTDDERLAWVQTEGLRLFHEELEREGGPEKVRWAGRKDRDGIPAENDVWWEHQIPVMLKNWAWQRRLDRINGLEMMAGGTEMEIRVTLPSGTLLVVRIDAGMLEGTDESVVLRDWKAGKPGGANPKQLAIYSWAATEGPGFKVAGAEFAYLRRPGETHRIDVSYLVEHVPALFEKYAAGMAADVFPIEPNQFCGGCPVRAACPHGQTLA